MTEKGAYTTRNEAASTASAAPHPSFSGRRNILLLLLIQFTTSGFVFYAYAVVFPEMVLAMKWDRGAGSLAQGLAFVSLGLFYPITSWIIVKYGVRRAYLIGFSVMATGLLAAGFLVTEIWHWTIVWGLIVGCGFGLTGPICVQTLVINWYSRARATVLGVVLTGTSLGGAVAQPVLAWVMDYHTSWQSGWLMSAAMASFALIATLFLINKPADIGQFPDGEPPATKGTEGAADPIKQRVATSYKTPYDWTFRQVLNGPLIYVLAIISIIYLASFIFLISHGALHLRDQNVPIEAVTSIFGLLILGSGVGRIPTGWLADRIAPRLIIGLYLAVMGLSTVLIWHPSHLISLFIATFCMGFCYGGMLVVMPSVMGNYYGEKVFPKINGVIAPLVLPFVALATAVPGYLFEAQGSYDAAFATVAVLMALGTLLAITIKPPVHEREKISAAI